MAMFNIVGLAVSLLVLVVIVTNVLIPAFINQSTSGWSTAMIAIWGLGGLLCAAGVIVFLGRALGLI